MEVIMQIANPIYDSVFNYLMEDISAANVILSSIIGEEIEILALSPQEFTTDMDKSMSRPKKRKKRTQDTMNFFSVYRLDFKAKIKTKAENKIVIIEIQKAKFSTDIMCSVKKSMPIITIYFLGHYLENLQGIPVIKSKRNYIDVGSGQEIYEHDEFIESLTHDSFIIQIPELKDKPRNDLEQLLTIFDQRNMIEKNHHLLEILEDSFPEKYQGVIRRLHKASLESDIRKKMDAEDEIIEKLEEKEREIFLRDQLIEEKDQVIEQLVEENRKMIEEKDKIIESLKK